MYNRSIKSLNDLMYCMIFNLALEQDILQIKLWYTFPKKIVCVLYPYIQL